MADEIRVEIDATDLDKLLKRFPQYEHIIFEEMEAAMHGSLAIFQEQVQGRTPVGVSGDLRKSIAPVVRGTPPNFVGELATPLLYGIVVERGRQPGSQPPSSALELWVRRKLGVAEDEVEQVAYLVARAIGRTPAPGVFMFEQGFEAGQSSVIKLWNDVVDKATRRIEATQL